MWSSIAVSIWTQRFVLLAVHGFCWCIIKRNLGLALSRLHAAVNDCNRDDHGPLGVHDHSRAVPILRLRCPVRRSDAGMNFHTVEYKALESHVLGGMCIRQ